MLVAGHTSALRRRSEIRAMPETEKPPAKPVDIYCLTLSVTIMLRNKNVTSKSCVVLKMIRIKIDTKD